MRKCSVTGVGHDLILMPIVADVDDVHSRSSLVSYLLLPFLNVA